MDLPHVVARAQANLERRGVADRVETVSMNFFEEVPAGDVYLASLILHDWSDDECETILGNVGRAIANDGRVVAIDYVVPPGDDPHFSKIVDLSMMATHSGRERTESEWRQLFERAGFTMIGVTSGSMPTSVIEARPATV